MTIEKFKLLLNKFEGSWKYTRDSTLDGYNTYTILTKLPWVVRMEYYNGDFWSSYEIVLFHNGTLIRKIPISKLVKNGFFKSLISGVNYKTAVDEDNIYYKEFAKAVNKVIESEDLKKQELINKLIDSI